MFMLLIPQRFYLLMMRKQKLMKMNARLLKYFEFSFFLFIISVIWSSITNKKNKYIGCFCFYKVQGVMVSVALLQGTLKTLQFWMSNFKAYFLILFNFTAFNLKCIATKPDASWWLWVCIWVCTVQCVYFEALIVNI